MTDHHINHSGQMNIARELTVLGWECLSYNEPEYDEDAKDLIDGGSWSGVAVHPDYPACVVAVRFYKDLNPGLPPRISTPRGKAWHIELRGDKIASGTGLKIAAAEGTKGAEIVAKRITRAAEKHWKMYTGQEDHEKDSVDTSIKFSMQDGEDTVIVEFKPDRSWTWIYFTGGRTNETLENSLRLELECKWSHKRNGYFIKEAASVVRLSKLKELCGIK